MMKGWIEALGDGQITEGELNGMKNGENISELSAEEQGAVVYDGATAYLFATTEIQDISNLMSWMFNFISLENELYDKASNMLTA